MKKFKKSGPRPPRNNHSRPRAAESRPKGRAVAGVHAVRELLEVRPRAVAEFWLREGYETHADLREVHDEAKRLRLRIHLVSPATLDRIVSVHQGVVAFATEEPELDFSKLKAKDRSTLLVLDEVEDPHNLGAVLRTAWLLGVDGVLTPESRSAPLSATVAKVARGGAEHVPVMRDSGLGETLKHLKEQGYWVFGLAAGGTKTLFEVEIPEKVIWVLGSESSGIRKPIARVCDELVGIPQVAAGASYNVSVAAALAMGETFRQREASPE